LPDLESTNILPAPLNSDRKKAAKALLSHRAGLSSVGGEKKINKKKNHLLVGGDTYLPALSSNRDTSPNRTNKEG
jgi:hypothetical protein